MASATVVGCACHHSIALLSPLSLGTMPGSGYYLIWLIVCIAGWYTLAQLLFHYSPAERMQDVFIFPILWRLLTILIACIPAYIIGVAKMRGFFEFVVWFGISFLIAWWLLSRLVRAIWMRTRIS